MLQVSFTQLVEQIQYLSCDEKRQLQCLLEKKVTRSPPR